MATNNNKGLTDDDFADLKDALNRVSTSPEESTRIEAARLARTILAPFYARKDKINLGMYGTGKSPLFSCMCFDSSLRLFPIVRQMELKSST